MPTCPDGHQSDSADFCDTCGIRIEGAAAPASATTSASASGAPPTGQSCPECGAAKTGMFCEVCGFNYAAGVNPNVAPASAAQSGTAASAVQSGTAVSAAQPGTAASAAQPGTAPSPTQPGPGTAFVGAASTTNVVGASAAPTTSGPSWTAVVTADRDYFNSVIAAGGPDAASIEFPGYCPERRFVLSGQEMRIGRRSASRGLDPEIDLTGPPTDPGVSHLHAVLIAQPDGTWSVLDPGSSNGTQVNGTDVVTGVPVPLHDGDRVSVGAWTVLTIGSA